MRVVELGDGTPEVAIVGAIHGDEPCGAHAIERLLESDPTVHRPVKLIVANEEALAKNVRYIDTDLNRAFGDDVDSSTHEYQLGRDLHDELVGCLVLSIHSTQSYQNPFGIVNDIDGPAAKVCPFLSIVAVVETTGEEGRLFAIDADLLEVEAGLQGSDAAAENAYRVAREFLTATGVLPGETVGREIPVYRIGNAIEKRPADDYKVFAENFDLVSAGDVFAAADGEELIATEDFYPILLSAYGYEHQFGYTGERIGVLEPSDSGRLTRGQ